MNNVFKRVFPLVLAYLAAGFVCALVIAFRQDVAALLLPPFEPSFKMRDAVIRFVQFFPALIAAGLLTGYSAAYCKLLAKPEKKQKKASDPFKGAFILCIALACVYAILAEGVAPVLKSRQGEAVAKTDSYHNYMRLCSRESEAGNFRAAFANAEAALAIWRDSDEAQRASDTARVMAEDLRDDSINSSIDSIEESGLILRGLGFPQSGYGARELLDMARAAAARMDFYNAHYYAALAGRIAADDGGDKEAAQRLATESWNRITAAVDEARAESERGYYDRKLKGYSDIQGGDFLSAYYHFLGMKEEEEAAGGGVDPDIANFLEIARQGVLGSFFFIDETEGLNLFEQEGGIFFTAPNEEGGRDAVLIGGVFRRGSSLEDAAYFRDFEMARLNDKNELVFQVSAAYAKMLPFADSEGATRPQIVLTSVDRAAGNTRVEPRVVAGAFPQQGGLSPSVLALDMPYKDIALVIEASAGANAMPIPRLFAFSRRAGRYGLQASVYLAELIERIADPFVVFIMSVLALVCACKLHIKERRPFSAWWIIPMPFIAVVYGYLIDGARQGVNVCTMLFAAKSLALAIPLSAGLIVVLLVAASLWFFAQARSKSLDDES